MTLIFNSKVYRDNILIQDVTQQEQPISFPEGSLASLVKRFGEGHAYRLEASLTYDSPIVAASAVVARRTYDLVKYIGYEEQINNGILVMKMQAPETARRLSNLPLATATATTHVAPHQFSFQNPKFHYSNKPDYFNFEFHQLDWSDIFSGIGEDTENIEIIDPSTDSHVKKWLDEVLSSD